MICQKEEEDHIKKAVSYIFAHELQCFLLYKRTKLNGITIESNYMFTLKSQDLDLRDAFTCVLVVFVGNIKCLNNIATLHQLKILDFNKNLLCVPMTGSAI